MLHPKRRIEVSQKYNFWMESNIFIFEGYKPPLSGLYRQFSIFDQRQKSYSADGLYILQLVFFGLSSILEVPLSIMQF